MLPRFGAEVENAENDRPPAGASAQGGAGGRPPPQKKLGRGRRPPPQTKKHRKAQKNDESALRAKDVIYYQCVTGVTRPPPNQNLVPTPLTSHYWFDRALLLFSFAEKNFNYFIFRCGSLVPVVVAWCG